MDGYGLSMLYTYNEGNPDYQFAIEQLREGGKEPTLMFDVAYNEYIATLITAPDLEDEWGEFRYDLYRQRKDNFRIKWGDKVISDIEGMLRKDEPPLMTELRQAREVLRPYWDIRTQLLQQYGLLEIDQQIRLMENVDPERAKMMRQQYGINRIDQYVQRYRQWLRQTDPEIYKYHTMFYA